MKKNHHHAIPKEGGCLTPLSEAFLDRHSLMSTSMAYDVCRVDVPAPQQLYQTTVQTQEVKPAKQFRPINRIKSTIVVYEQLHTSAHCMTISPICSIVRCRPLGGW